MVFFRTLFGPASCSAYIELGSVNLMRTFVYVVHSSVILSCVFVYIDHICVILIVPDCICSGCLEYFVWACYL